MSVPRLEPAQVGIVFDLDNTLVASRIDFVGMKRAVLAALQEAGLQVTDDQLRWPVGQLADWAGLPGSPPGLHQQVWQLIEQYELAGMAGAVATEGAVSVCRTLCEQGYPLAVLTNNTRAAAIAVLQEQGLLQFFRAVFGREDVPRMKPAPDGVRVAAAALGEPPRLYVVGDAWLDGVAARDSGARFIAVEPFRPGPVACPVWRHIKALPELLQLNLCAPDA